MWIQKGKPALVLAPMEGVTDAPMRAFLSERGGFDYCVSEFIRISQELLPNKVFYRHVPELFQGSLTPFGTPVQIQLLGGDPEKLSLTAVQLVGLGAKAIDINFGCPAPTVNRHDGGATLLKYPHRIFQILKTIRSCLPNHIPLSAKLRLGWDNPEAIFENTSAAEEAGASWLTVHGRTKIQGYAPPVRWDLIGKARERILIPVIANGDITTLDDFKRCQQETGAEHFMIGRGALANLLLPWQIKQYLRGESPLAFNREKKSEWLGAIQRFTEFSEPFGSEPGYSTRRIKQWINLANKQGQISWFDQIKRCESLENIFCVLSQ